MTTRTALEARCPPQSTVFHLSLALHMCPSEEKPGPHNVLRVPPRSQAGSTARLTEQS